MTTKQPYSTPQTKVWAVQTESYLETISLPINNGSSSGGGDAKGGYFDEEEFDEEEEQQQGFFPLGL